MRHEIRMPQLSNETTEGVIVNWFVDVGAKVMRGDLIVEVQVEKVSAEIHAPADGYLERLVSTGAIAKQGEVIGIVDG